MSSGRAAWDIATCVRNISMIAACDASFETPNRAVVVLDVAMAMDDAAIICLDITSAMHDAA